MRRVARVLAGLTALVAASSLCAAQSSTRAVPSRDLMGMAVLDRSGQPLGRLEDLVVRMRSGEVRYAVISRSAEREERYLLAATSLRRQANALVANVEGAQFAERLIPLGDGAAGRVDDAVQAALEQLPGPAEPASVRWRTRSASSLLGALVETQDGRHIGTVQDLVIDVEAAKVRFAVVALPQGSRARPIGLPLSAFRPVGRSPNSSSERLEIALRPAGAAGQDTN